MALGGLLTAATVPLATPVCQWLLPVDVPLENVTSFLMKGSLAATLILFAPSTLLLGIVSPMAIRLLSDAGVGRAAGRVFAVSTVGSIAGTYLPTLWLLPTFGSRTTLLIAAALLIVPAAVGLLLSAGRAGAVVATIAVVGWTGTRAFAELRPNRGDPKLPRGGTAVVLAECETPYQYVTVRDDRRTGSPPATIRQLTINEGVFTYHSLEIEGSALTGQRYYDDHALLPLLLDVPPGRELRAAVIGLACGVTPHQWKHFWGDVYKLRVDGAEIDPVVLDLGRRYFFDPAYWRDADSWLTPYALDGRQMLAASPAGTTYHMIVVDAFSQEMYVPFHLGTREFFKLCKDRLVAGGVFAINVYAYRPDSPNLEAMENTLATVFGRCLRVRQWWGSNFVLVAKNGDVPADTTRLLAGPAEARFGRRADVSEWDKLIAQAAWIPDHTTVVRPDPSKLVLTDDYCPLEAMTDRFVAREEEEIFRR
jgi:spermidine synthase